MQPFDYQQECLEAINAAREAGANQALIEMASGLGKTVTGALDAKHYLAEGGRLLYLCHQNDILRQARKTYEAVLGEGFTFGSLHGHRRDLKDLHEVSCLFSSFQTMREWREVFMPYSFDYIQVDESHHTSAQTYLETLQYFQPDFLLGKTATPDRGDLQDIREIYGQEIFSLPLEEALARGLLTPVDYRLLGSDFQDLAELDDPRLLNLTIKDLNERLFQPKAEQEIVRIVKERIAEIPHARAIIFCPSIDDCERLAPQLAEALPIHSRLSRKEQEERLARFRTGQVEAVLTVDKFNEGIDVPEANLIVFLRSTASRTIFFQQLGRGLRLAEGKEKVVVLDFVGNCQRLEMVHQVWSSVARAERSYKTHESSQTVTTEGQFDLSAGHIEFAEQAQDVFKLVQAIRQRPSRPRLPLYTREQLIEQIKELAKELGRPPKAKELSEHGLASREVFRRGIGTWREVLEAADLDPDWRPSYTRQELIDQLKALAQKLGRTPTTRDLTHAVARGECASISYFRSEFGNWTDARLAADLGVDTASTQPAYSREELITQLQQLAQELGRIPTQSDIVRASRAEETAPYSSFSKEFGSLRAAREAAGLVPKPITHYTRDKLIEQFKRLAEELGHLPRVPDIEAASREGKCATMRYFYREFGSALNLRVAAGMRTPVGQKYTPEELIRYLHHLHYRLGKTPTRRDVEEAYRSGLGPPIEAFFVAFGLFSIAKKRANLDRGMYQEKELLDHLRQLAHSLGRSPTTQDVSEASKRGEGPSTEPYIRCFGSLREARVIAGLEGKLSGGRKPRRAIQKYSDQELLEALKRLAHKLGRSPAETDIRIASLKGECPTTSTFGNRFGSLNEAKRAAGLEVSSGHRSEKEAQLIRELQALARELGRVPTANEAAVASKADRCSSVGTFQNHFGSWESALEEAELTRPHRRQGRRERRKARREELLQQLNTLRVELGRIPTEEDVVRLSAQGKCATITTFRYNFGSWPWVLLAAGWEQELQGVQ